MGPAGRILCCKQATCHSLPSVLTSMTLLTLPIPSNMAGWLGSYFHSPSTMNLYCGQHSSVQIECIFFPLSSSLFSLARPQHTNWRPCRLCDTTAITEAAGCWVCTAQTMCALRLRSAHWARVTYLIHAWWQQLDYVEVLACTLQHLPR